MAYNLTSFLEEFAHFSNVGAIFVVITTLTCMIVYIYRVTDELARRQEELRTLQQVPAQVMGQVHNPFVVKLDRPHEANISGFVHVSLTLRAECVLKPMWGADITQVYHLIHAPWNMIRDGFDPDSLHSMMEGHVLAFGETLHLLPSFEKQMLDLQPPSDLDLGPVPRSRYPLVLVSFDQAALESEYDSAGTSVVCLFTLFHMRDAMCPGESHIIAQYARTTTSVLNLQQVYVTGDVSDDDVSAPQSSHDSTINSSLTMCIICSSNHVSRVLLPCRHACVCDSCFDRLEKCPMCRGIITTYFCMTDRASSPGGDFSEQVS